MRLNFHEFNHIENGRKMLVITEGAKYLDLVEIGLPYKNYPVIVTGFQEVDSKTGKVLSNGTLFLEYLWVRPL